VAKGFMEKEVLVEAYGDRSFWKESIDVLETN